MRDRLGNFKYISTLLLLLFLFVLLSCSGVARGSAERAQCTPGEQCSQKSSQNISTMRLMSDVPGSEGFEDTSQGVAMSETDLAREKGIPETGRAPVSSHGLETGRAPVTVHGSKASHAPEAAPDTEASHAPEAAPDLVADAGQKYKLSSIHSVNGRQGICAEGDYYWVSGSGTLTKYDKNWNIVAENTDPFLGFELEVNHIGDIDVWQNELYLGVEYFMDGEGKNIQVAVYDGDTLLLKRVFPFSADTGQMECSGIAVDPVSSTVYMCSWIDDESSSYLYMYDLESGRYKGRLFMDPAPKWIQGVASCNGALYVTSDDGDADFDAPDHMYRIEVSEDSLIGKALVEKNFIEVPRQGEIEGLCFSRDENRFYLLYNRGARIVLGMPKGFYDGYSREIHEVLVFDVLN